MNEKWWLHGKNDEEKGIYSTALVQISSLSILNIFQT